MSDQTSTSPEVRLPAKVSPDTIDRHAPGVHKNIPLAKLIELRKKQLTYQEIADILGCTKQNVHERLQPFVEHVDHLQSIKDYRADVLTVVGNKILSSLTEEDLQKSSAYQKVGMYSLLYDKERLERDKSTANISYADMSRDLEEIRKQKAKLAQELGIDSA